VIIEAEPWHQRRLHALEALANDLRAEGAFADAALAATSRCSTRTRAWTGSSWTSRRRGWSGSS
jgi:hypothetical protein